ncbi:MAG: SRPBCC family protein [Bacteroidia bacterium]|nr:SRPBCC family protein [Bacteroidia bacterium]
MKFLKYIGVFIVFITASYFGLVFMAPSKLNFQVNEDFNAPIETVFSFMTEPSILPQWVEGIDSFYAENLIIPKVGDQYKLYFQGENSMVMNKTVLLYEANKLYSTHGSIKDFFDWNEKITFVALDSNRTRVSNIVTLKSLSQKTRLLTYAEETHRKNVAGNYLKLKKLIE